VCDQIIDPCFANEFSICREGCNSLSPKNINKKEYLPLSEQTLCVLDELKKLTKNTASYLFLGKSGDKPVRDIKTFWEKVIKEANLKNIRIHDLRHTHASHLVSSGLSLSIVGKLLGHTQAATTQRYAHLADEPLRHAAALFGNQIDALSSSKRVQLKNDTLNLAA